MTKDKIFLNHKKLLSRLNGLRKKNKKIVFTNGCFDILHRGHIEYLTKAKALGDILVVALNSDRSVKKLKGDSRPINKACDRAFTIASLQAVDLVTLFSQETPSSLIRLLKPDVLVKGGDWKKHQIAGADHVNSYGGKVILIRFKQGYSTTKLIKKIACK